jgi:site-specific DNA-methyltransferase (adenine-specific)
MNERFVEMCRRLGLSGAAASWNHLLMNLRKGNRLKDMQSSKKTTFSRVDIDKYSFACEIAIQTLSDQYKRSLDDILCDPKIAAEFDHEVFKIAHQDISSKLTPLQVRWAVLRMRKRSKTVRKHVRRLETHVLQLPNEETKWPTFSDYRGVPKCLGVYDLRIAGKSLYVGETLDLQSRFELQLNPKGFDFWGNPKEEIEIRYRPLPEGEKPITGEAIQSHWVNILNPIGNYRGNFLSTS